MKIILILALFCVSSSIVFGAEQEEGEKKLLDLDPILKPLIEGTLDGVSKGLVSLLDQLKSLIPSIKIEVGKRDLSLEKVKQSLNDVKVKMIQVATSTYNRVKDAVLGLFNKIKSIGKRNAFLSQDAVQIYQAKIDQILKDAVSHIQDIFVGLADGTLGKVLESINGGKRDLEDLSKLMEFLNPWIEAIKIIGK